MASTLVAFVTTRLFLWCSIKGNGYHNKQSNFYELKAKTYDNTADIPFLMLKEII
jgi:hypothetical protein